MRSLVLIVGLAACGEVKNNVDAQVDSPRIDGAIDAPGTASPRLRWTFDGDTNNSGTINGFALATPSGVSFVTGKVGMAASFGSGQFASVAGMRAVLGSFPRVTVGFWLKEPGNLNAAAVFSNLNRTMSPFGGVSLGFDGASASLCAATTSNSLLGGSCLTAPDPGANAFHHWIIRYNGTGTGAGQGAPVEVYIDNTLAITRQNDTANDPVFNSGDGDTLFVGTPGTVVDDVRIYDQVFTLDEQCTLIIGGTLNGTTCVLP